MGWGDGSPSPGQREVAPIVPWVVWSLGGLAIPVGAIAPRAIRPVWIGVMVLTFPIGFVISHVMLALVYHRV